jgi:hypothetical protein
MRGGLALAPANVVRRVRATGDPIERHGRIDFAVR